MNTRRDFIVQAGSIAVGAALVPATLAGALSPGATQSGAAPGGISADPKRAATASSPPKRAMLILGGTGFLGPQIVHSARAKGFEVTLFNRGKTAPGLFPDVEHIEGDRYADLAGLKKAVESGRRWDAVVDTFTYVPKTVTDAMDILKPAMDQFVVISTISVYASSDSPNADESAALATIPDEVAAGITTHQQVGQHYGAMKARVEKAAEENFPGKVTIIRPGLIVGPRDTTGRYSYWPIRASEGGRMIAPGTGEDFVQIIDSRDLGEFTVACCTGSRHFGVFNAVNPAKSLTMKALVDAAVTSGAAGATPVWIPTDFLGAHGVNPWQQMPAWIPSSAPGYAGAGTLNTDRAVKAGLTIRPISETNAAILDYYATRGKEITAEKGEEAGAKWRKTIRGGLAAEKEVEVLKAWDARGG